jgi:hypothetical protein
MDTATFDRLTRRVVLGGLAGGSVLRGFWPSETAGKHRSQRKRCQKKHRVYCSGRCCPEEHTCEHSVCLATCGNGFDCSPGSGEACGRLGECFCTSTVGGSAACMNVPVAGECDAFPACNGNGDCASGRVCVICSCAGQIADRRCLRPCATA